MNKTIRIDIDWVEIALNIPFSSFYATIHKHVDSKLSKNELSKDVRLKIDNDNGEAYVEADVTITLLSAGDILSDSEGTLR